MPEAGPPARPPRRLRPLPALAGLLALAGLAWALWRPAGPPDPRADVVGLLSAPAAEGFDRVTGPEPLAFPRDHGAHPGYQTEWWYYTGNLVAAEGPGAPRRFGFQLTFFRRALAPEPQPGAAGTPAPTAASAWTTTQVYLAHFALTDVAAPSFHSAERLQRGAVGLAGAEADPLRVWAEGWEAAAIPDRATAFGPAMRLTAEDGPAAIDLALTPLKAPAAHGEAGFSPKGPEPGNASMYYSFSRLAAEGTVRTAEGEFEVDGTAWMDHEWSTSALGGAQVGWDWFSLQLDDGTDLMLFHLREAGGGVAATSSGSLVGPDGEMRHLGRDDFRLEVTRQWTSPHSRARYPAGWRMDIPSEGIELELRPQAADQELQVGLRYWEGSVAVEGEKAGRAVDGFGYAELTGYSGEGGRAQAIASQVAP